MAKRSKVKPFVKVCNFNHMMPTRYSIDVALEKSLVNKECFKDPALRKKRARRSRTSWESATRWERTNGSSPNFASKTATITAPALVSIYLLDCRRKKLIKFFHSTWNLV